MIWADLALIGISLFCLLLLATAIGSLLVWVPYVPTPRPVVRRMVELAELRGQETVYDLGCGDARILIEAKRRTKGIRAIGYELPPGIWLLGKLRILFAGESIAIRMGDFLGADLRDADVIFLYLVPEVLPGLERKFTAELRPGTRIISHGFPLKSREPKCVERPPLWSWRLFHHAEKRGPRVFVYTW